MKFGGNCFHGLKIPSEKEFALKGKNLLPLLQESVNSFFLEQTPFSKGRQTSYDRAASLESIVIPLKKIKEPIKLTE